MELKLPPPKLHHRTQLFRLRQPLEKPMLNTQSLKPQLSMLPMKPLNKPQPLMSTPPLNTKPEKLLPNMLLTRLPQSSTRLLKLPLNMLPTRKLQLPQMLLHQSKPSSSRKQLLRLRQPLRNSLELALLLKKLQ